MEGKTHNYPELRGRSHFFIKLKRSSLAP